MGRQGRFWFHVNICEDYLAQFTDEKYEVLEGTPVYKLFHRKGAKSGVSWKNYSCKPPY